MDTRDDDFEDASSSSSSSSSAAAASNSLHAQGSGSKRNRLSAGLEVDSSDAKRTASQLADSSADPSPAKRRRLVKNSSAARSSDDESEEASAEAAPAANHSAEPTPSSEPAFGADSDIMADVNELDLDFDE